MLPRETSLAKRKGVSGPKAYSLLLVCPNQEEPLSLKYVNVKS